MKCKLLSVAILACFTMSAFAAEDPIVSDGLSIPTYLIAGDTTSTIYSQDITGAFTTSAASNTVTVAHPAAGGTMVETIAVGTKISFTNTSATVGGLTMDGTWTIASIIDSTHFTFTHTSTASSTVSTPTANTTVTYSTPSQNGKLRFFCRLSHLGYDDPVVNPGVPGAAHLHLFFGNTTTDANSTYSSLRSAGDGTCDGGPLNRTAYWMPAMIDSSILKVRIPIYFEWYYEDFRNDLADFTSPVCSGTGLLQDGRPAACPQKAIKKIERGMRGVFGFRPSIGAFPTAYGYNGMLDTAWNCIAGANGAQLTPGYRYLSHRSNPALGITGDATCPSDGHIYLRIGSPSCWDGNHDNADHYSHFAFAGQDGNGNLVCPATHPNRFISFTVIVEWSYTGPISNVNSWYLSSDRHNGANFEAGETMHWDMFWAWDDTIQQWFHEHINGMSPSSAAGAPYIFDSAGQSYVGGPYLRNTNNGGLGSDCTALGFAGGCAMKAATSGISDTLLDIPALRRHGKGLMR